MATATTEDGSGPGALTALHAVASPLALHALRASNALVGRPAEVAALDQELAAATQRLVGVTLEGEPGIGKTRLLLAAGEMAIATGFTTIGVTGDEELRGPFLVARSIVGAIEAEAARGTDAESSLAVPGLADADGDAARHLGARGRRHRRVALADLDCGERPRRPGSHQ